MRALGLRRALAVLAVAAVAGCGGTRACKHGTLLLTITLTGPALAATNVEVDVETEDGDHRSGIFALSSLAPGTVEVDFPTGYPEGKQITVRVSALKGAGALASGRATLSATPGCSTLALTVGGEDGGASCEPGTDDRCSDDRKSVEACRADGSGFDTLPCAVACGDTGAPAHCLQLEPSGAISPSDYAGTLAVTLAADTTFNTDTGEVTGGLARPASATPNQTDVSGGVGFRSIAQPGSTVRVGVFSFAGLTIASGVTVRVTGKSPLALVSSADVSVDGTVDLRGDCAQPPTGGGGAGGQLGVNNGDGLGTRPGRAGTGGANQASGGGGGGVSDVGGRGGNGADGIQGGAGGTAFGDLTVEPLLLVGGSGGGAGGGPSGGAGGHGAGSLQLAVSGALSIGGTVHAGGCGGKAGSAQSGGGGGGGGGLLLFEAGTIHLATSALIAANGGGGGGGDGGGQGGDGAPNTSFAAGGTAANAGTVGGQGGGLGRIRGQNGADPTGNAKNGGGGGGAAGRIAWKTYAGTITDDGATLSPAKADLSSGNLPAVTTTRATFQ